MCGRYVIARTPGQLALDFQADIDETLTSEDIGPNWNTAPTQTVPILLERLDGEGVLRRELHAARWGLVPSWSKELSTSARTFNARSETILTKPSFRNAIRHRRCAIPADGYYEWFNDESTSGRRSTKQPYYVHPPEGHMIWFAGIYEWWRIPGVHADAMRPGQSRSGRSGESQWLLSCSILTTQAPPKDSSSPHLQDLNALHHRLPVALAQDTVTEWITPDKERTETLLHEVTTRVYDVAQSWRMHAVDAGVGSVKARGPQLKEPRHSMP